MLGHENFSTIFGGGGGDRSNDTSGSTYQPSHNRYPYQCSEHGWFGILAQTFTCPTCECKSKTQQSCRICYKPFLVDNPDKLFTIHHTSPTISESDQNKYMRKYSKGNRRIIYFCDNGCYQSYKQNKSKCVMC